MFQEISVWAFDLLKKHNMEKYYLQGRVWGRKDSNEDIAKAVNLISDRHYERCLDVGAGLGHYTETVTGLCDTVVAIDISKKSYRVGASSFVASNKRSV